MNDHIISMCHAVYYHPENIHTLKPVLSQEALVTVVHAIVTCHTSVILC